jgi:hypothetical protein
MIAKNQNGSGGVLSRIHNSIIETYNTVENFIDLITKEIIDKNYCKYSNH